MEGISIINYKGKEIMYIDYSSTGGLKEKILQIMKDCGGELLKYPPKSALTITNLTGFIFDTEVLNAMKESQNKTAPHQKKSALIGMKPIHKAAYNFLLALTTRNLIKAFDTEEEALEWLVND